MLAAMIFGAAAATGSQEERQPASGETASETGREGHSWAQRNMWADANGCGCGD